jgi:hypothetical protein
MMAALKRRFRALANGGISPIEATRREEAVARAQAGVDPVKVLPPAMPHFGGPVALVPDAVEVSDARCLDGHPVSRFGAPCAVCDIALKERLRARAMIPPVITVTISGAPHSGKSVLSHVLISALAAEGIVVTVKDELRPLRWRGRGGALDNLIDRGVSVVLVKREAEVEDRKAV